MTKQIPVYQMTEDEVAAELDEMLEFRRDVSDPVRFRQLVERLNHFRTTELWRKRGI